MRFVSQPAGARWRSADATLDAVALAALLLFCVAATILRSIRDDWLSGYDGFSYFLPYWGYLGDRLRRFEIPAWNPYYGGGAPMAGDPGGGWLYLPVMLTFTLFSAITAWKVLILLMTLISGVAIYVFARRIGMTPPPALFASTAFAIGPVAYGITTDRIAISTQYPSIALGLLAAEMALRANRTVGLLSWIAVGGLALSQNIASWPAQGSLYTAMYIAGWLAYRWLFAPLPEVGSRLAHLKRAIVFGAGMLVMAIAFAGAAFWPALEYTGQSTIAGGNYTNAVQGVNLPTAPIVNLIAVMLRDTSYSRLTATSGAVVLLALFAVAMWRNRYGIPFFAVASWLFIDISANESLTLRFFYLVPYFEHIHAHRPTAASAYVYPAFFLLAAAGLQLLIDEVKASRILRALAISGAAFAGLVALCRWRDLPVGAWPIGTAVLAAVLILLCALRLGGVSIGWHGWHGWRAHGPRLSAALLVAVLLIYPTAVDYGRIANGTGQTPGLEDVDPATDDIETVVNTTVKREDPGTAAGFLQQQRDTQPPFRYAAYVAADTASGQHLPFVFRRLDPEIVLTLAGSRAGFLGLQQISGYNPIHLRNYVEFFEVMQGKEQNYHFVDIFYQALDQSQLFEMLNVRYVTIPITLGFNPPIAVYGVEVFRDEQVIIYENPRAFPRAWMVHEVRQAEDGEELRQLNDYEVDGRAVAFVDGELPGVTAPADGVADDAVTITRYEPEEIALTARSDGAGLLVLSEVYTTGWRATVDGVEIDVLETNHALRGVPVPAGEHEVVLRYEPMTLTIGLWSTGLAGAAMLGVWGWALIGWRRSGISSRTPPRTWSIPVAVPVEPPADATSDRERRT